MYLWVNCINDKFYIGSHWGHEDDGYMGSGVLFKKAVKKYGKQNFKRILLEFRNYTSRRELANAENFYLQRLDVVNKKKYYNLTATSGCSLRSPESRKKQSEKLRGRKQSHDTISKRMSKLRGINNPHFSGYYLTPKGKFITAREAGEANGMTTRQASYLCKTRRPNGWSFEEVKHA